jgi:hypothetical protein
MSIKVNEDSMWLEINGAEITAAVRLEYLWRVTGWPRLLSRQRGILVVLLAMTVVPPGGAAPCWSFRA